MGTNSQCRCPPWKLHREIVKARAENAALREAISKAWNLGNGYGDVAEQMCKILRKALETMRPWLDANGVYHRHNGIDFPNPEACPYCQLQAIVDERDNERRIGVHQR